MADISDLLRLPQGPVELGSLDPHGKPGFDGNKADGAKALPAMAEELRTLQEQLFASGYTDGTRRILLVLQGMDTSGKGGVLSHTVGLFDPSGTQLHSFKAPTEEELAHDFLWRVEKQLPDPGKVGIFDRSHYEDVLVVRVHELAKAEEVERRYGAINDWEKRLADDGVTIIKCMLHISPEEQKKRLLARLDEPTKQWKFKPGDVDERELWPAYQQAYELALSRCNTDAAPWYVVPSDRKWYRNWAIGMLLLEALRGMDLSWPVPDYDIAEQRKRLEDEHPVIPLVTATRYVAPLREGGSLPGIVEADDLGTYVCKFRGAGQGIGVLVAEVVVGELARRLGLRTPVLVGMELGEGIARYEADEEVQDLLNASLGLNLGVDFLPGSFGYDSSFEPDPGWAARVLWLDAFVANVDRSWRNPNLLVWHGDPWLIDHGASLYFHHGWSTGLTDPSRFAVQPYVVGDHVLGKFLDGVAGIDEAMAAAVDDALLAEVTTAVPDEWLAPVPGAETPDALREAYRTFLRARLDGGRAWVPGRSPS